MKRNRIGDTPINTKISYWSGGKPADMMRQSERELYAKIDLYQEIANYSDDLLQIDESYTEMDKLYAIICLIENFGSDISLLAKAGIIMNEALVRGDFMLSYASLETRNEHINNVITKMIEDTTDISLDETVSSDFILWFKGEVLEKNYYIDPETGRHTDVCNVRSAIGDTINDAIFSGMKNSGAFYPYCLASSSLLNTVASKYKKQRQLISLDRLEATGVGLTRSAMNTTITSGIISATKGKTPNQMVESLKKGQDPAIGLWGLIIKAITALIDLVKSIFDKKKSEVDKKTAEILSKNNLNVIAPDSIDFDGDGVADAYKDPITGEIVYYNKPKTSLPNWLIFGGLAVAAYFLLDD